VKYTPLPVPLSHHGCRHWWQDVGLSPEWAPSQLRRGHSLHPQWLSDFEMSDSPGLKVKTAPCHEPQHPFFDFSFSRPVSWADEIWNSLDLLGSHSLHLPSCPKLSTGLTEFVVLYTNPSFFIHEDKVFHSWSLGPSRKPMSFTPPWVFHRVVLRSPSQTAQTSQNHFVLILFKVALAPTSPSALLLSLPEGPRPATTQHSTQCAFGTSR
jgi:hypothetical protein